jgi:hypothetical protein
LKLERKKKATSVWAAGLASRNRFFPSDSRYQAGHSFAVRQCTYNKQGPGGQMRV